jgi:transposase
MTILTSSTTRDLVFWLIWLSVVVMMLLPQAGIAQVPAVEIWQSAYDPLSWLGPGLRIHWYTAWGSVRRWIHRWQGWISLTARLWACRNLAEVIQVLTRRQIVRYLGALPILVALLERLGVRQIINRHCPTQSPIDHGTVALVLVLNRLMAPRPLYKIVNWLSTTLIAEYLGISRDKFNDDRLGRTLDALAGQLPVIWNDIQQQMVLHYQIDLSLLFYDLTALIMTGKYAQSELVDYGFAHNTPSDDPKLKLGVVANWQGIPLLFQPWCGRTADKATVQANMHNLRAFLQQQGWQVSQVLVVGDCANLNSQLAFAYEAAHLRYLAGLAKLEKVHRQLVLAPTERDFERLPLAEDYWGVPCEVPFTHDERTLIHRGVVVRSDPMRQVLHQERQKHIRELWGALNQIQGKIGQKRYRSEKEVSRRVATQVKHSPVGKLIGVQVSTQEGQIQLAWWIDANALQDAQRSDGRFLLVTNDPHLTYSEMLALYRKKDTLEKRFEVTKQDLKVRPLHVHSDERIQAMLLINLIALLAYSLLERQAEQAGLCLTARRIIDQLSTLQVQVIEAWDGSRSWSWQETLPGQVQLLLTGLQALSETPRAALHSGPLTRNLLPDGLPFRFDAIPLLHQPLSD